MGNPKPKKSKKHRRDIAERLDDFVGKMLASMMSYGETVDYAIDKFGCDERTVTRAIARVRQGWQQSAAASVDERRARFLAELEHAWKSALQMGDYRAIAVMARTRADVEGIKAVKKVEHSGVLGLRPVAAMSPEERRREIDVLLAKQKALAGASKPVIDATSTESPSSPEVDDDEQLEVVRASKPARKKRKQQVH
jgi:hypothetical protein